MVSKSHGINPLDRIFYSQFLEKHTKLTSFVKRCSLFDKQGKEQSSDAVSATANCVSNCACARQDPNTPEALIHCKQCVATSTSALRPCLGGANPSARSQRRGQTKETIGWRQQKRAKPDFGGARRDRTDDLMLAKHALSQLSYGP